MIDINIKNMSTIYTFFVSKFHFSWHLIPLEMGFQICFSFLSGICISRISLLQSLESPVEKFDKCFYEYSRIKSRTMKHWTQIWNHWSHILKVDCTGSKKLWNSEYLEEKKARFFACQSNSIQHLWKVVWYLRSMTDRKIFRLE